MTLKRWFQIGLIASIAIGIIIILSTMLLPGPARIAGQLICPQGWQMERETSSSREGTRTHFTCTSPDGEEQDRGAALLLIQLAFVVPAAVFGVLLVRQADKDALAAETMKKDKRRKKSN